MCLCVCIYAHTYLHAYVQGGESSKVGQKNATDDGSILAIAWHNIAVEQEHLSMLDQALISVSMCVYMYVCIRVCSDSLAQHCCGTGAFEYA